MHTTPLGIVLMMGLEPIWLLTQQILSLPRIPVPTHQHDRRLLSGEAARLDSPTSVRCGSILLARFELAWLLRQRILSPLCLPVPPQEQREKQMTGIEPAWPDWKSGILAAPITFAISSFHPPVPCPNSFFFRGFPA